MAHLSRDCVRVKMYFYNRNHSISRTKTKTKWTKGSMNKYRKTLKKERKTQKFGVSSDDDRSSLLEVYFRGGALKNFSNFTGAYLCVSWLKLI